LLPAEPFIAWRYLHRGRTSAPVVWATIGSLLLAVGVQVLLFAYGQVVLGAVLTVPTVLLFYVCLCLNVFSVFTTVSIIGVIVGVSALTLVLSVASGFQASFRDKILGVNAHVLVLKYGLDFSEYREVSEKIEKVPGVQAVAPFVFNEMMVAHGPALSGVLIKGIDPARSPKVLDIAERLTEGKVADLAELAPPNDGGAPLPAIFLGKELTRKLKVKLGDRVRVVSPKANFDPAAWAPEGGGGPSTREFRLAGIFYSGFDEYDRRLAYVTIPEAQAFFKAGDVVTGVEMKIADVERAKPLAREIHKALGGTPYRVIDWEELNHNLFTALRMQKIALTIFLTLIILVAAFNIVAAMTMLVVEKVKEIAILKSMGMGAGRMAGVFQIAGLTIGLFGTVAGIGLGLLCCAVVERFGYALDPKVYLIDKLPVLVQPLELLLVAGITLAVCLVATLYPAIRAARLEPVEGLRYE
jgi:lipoprotein-releasing system permease protein